MIHIFSLKKKHLSCCWFIQLEKNVKFFYGWWFACDYQPFFYENNFFLSLFPVNEISKLWYHNVFLNKLFTPKCKKKCSDFALTRTDQTWPARQKKELFAATKHAEISPKREFFHTHIQAFIKSRNKLLVNFFLCVLPPSIDCTYIFRLI